MKIRNIPYKKLNITEKKIVKRHFEYCMNDNSMSCKKEHRNILDFWEAHRKADTNFGKYAGWIK